MEPIQEHHLAWILPLYGASRRQYDLLVRGGDNLPADKRVECRRLLDQLVDEELDAVLHLLQVLANSGL